jgi:hypothetical protein
MSASSRANFRQFLLKYFTPDDSRGAAAATATQPSS